MNRVGNILPVLITTALLLCFSIDSFAQEERELVMIVNAGGGAAADGSRTFTGLQSGTRGRGTVSLPSVQAEGEFETLVGGHSEGKRRSRIDTATAGVMQLGVREGKNRVEFWGNKALTNATAGGDRSFALSQGRMRGDGSVDGMLDVFSESEHASETRRRGSATTAAVESIWGEAQIQRRSSR